MIPRRFPRRRFGRTGLDISIFTLGGMRHMHSWKDLGEDEIPAESLRNVEATLHRAWEVGINHFDTARGYGTSELEMGRFLGDFPRDELVITTKVSPRADTDDFARVVEECLTRLRLDHVDILDLHGINNRETFDWAMRKGGCLEVLQRFQEQGAVNHIAFSTHGPLDLIIEALDTQAFAAVTLHFYHFSPRNLAAVQRAGELDMGVLILSPHEKGGLLWKPTDRLREATAPLHPMTFNSLWTLSHPEVTSLTLGARKPGEIEDHLDVLNHVDDISGAIEGIAERVAEAAREPLGDTWCSVCWECLPCPENIHIPEVLRLRNLLVGLGMEEFAKMRYNLFEQAGHWFPGNLASKCTECGDCLPRCPEHLDIP
ncbi:aldo/keto reductase, partial [Candidatus Sumerlaeota bacterium]|nr:aldo/keto reductase [Candidatus Sumerlaeota bacterium]